jgi:hypothetical protein
MLLSGACAWECAADADWDSADREIAACFDAMDQDPALQTVNQRFARRTPTAAQLADTAVSSQEEADQLRLRVAKTRPCRDLRLAAVQRFHPLLEPAYRILYYKADQVFGYLANQLITYGEANRLAQASLQEFLSRQRAYLDATPNERRRLSEEWDELLQRSHSNPPPDNAPAKCEWVGTILECQ